MNRKVVSEETHQLHMVDVRTAVQSKKLVSDYFTSKQIFPFGFAEKYTILQ